MQDKTFSRGVEIYTITVIKLAFSHARQSFRKLMVAACGEPSAMRDSSPLAPSSFSSEPGERVELLRSPRRWRVVVVVHMDSHRYRGKGQWHAPVDQKRQRPTIGHPAAVFRTRLCHSMVGVEKEKQKIYSVLRTKLRPRTCVKSPLWQSR